ncbi:exodeoxyribonuclease V subunit alpha [Rhabdochromatium marinum]|nr:exodeoxyribonuclease V subunit alpha [Rhabdochromatium marinum]
MPAWQQSFADWVTVGALRPLDLALTRFIATRGPVQDEAVLLAVALTSERNGHGHVCLDLAATLAAPDAVLGPLRDQPATSPELLDSVRQSLRERLQGLGSATVWAERLAASACINDQRLPPTTKPIADADQDADARPLVLAGQADRPLLYLRRYWQYEQRIRHGLEQRLQHVRTVDVAALRQQLDRLFHPSDTLDWQRIACALATRHNFFIITGGPGTGKTTTVVRLLAVLQALVPAGQPPLRIELAAPTGKAAARLNESITDQRRHLPEAFATPEAQPTRVKTLHRLLGAIPGSRHFRHHAAQPLPADLVVVDEASMVDVEMMANLLDAMPADARLILLGDKDQLSSVEAGAVLGDLCQGAAQVHYRPTTVDWLEQVTGWRLPTHFIDPHGPLRAQAIVMLRNSHRFNPQGGIGALAALVNQTEAPARLHAVQQLFQREATTTDASLGCIQAVPLPTPDALALAELVWAGYGGPNSYLEVMRCRAPEPGAPPEVLEAWAAEVLEARKGFQLLTALRAGPWGVEGLNQFILRTLRAAQPPGHASPAGLGESSSGAPRSGEPGSGQSGALAGGQWFPGRPVLVTRNDYGLNLMNGDIGVTLAVPRPGDKGASSASRQPMLRVAFPTVEGGVRWILPSRLQAVETVFAMTVHKSQGSEFDHAALVLPDHSNPVLTRELLYTAITRASSRFTLLYGSEVVLGEALACRVERVSGLAV